MWFHAKANSDTVVLLVIATQCFITAVLAETSHFSRQVHYSKGIQQAEKDTSVVGSETSAVIQTVQAPVAQTEKRVVVTAPPADAPSQGPPVSLNEIVSSRRGGRLVPISYEFSYGTPSHSHIQNKRPDGIIEGRYVIHAPDGQHRTVDYVADKGGFRAGVATNEPGTQTILEGASKMVSSAMSGVDAALKYGSRPHLRRGAQTIKQSANRSEAPLTSSASTVNTATSVQLTRPASTQHPPSLESSNRPEVHEGPLRVVDIQPLPAPLIRYGQFQYPAASSNVQLIHAQASAPAPVQAQPFVAPSQPMTHSFQPLRAPAVHNAVATVMNPVTVKPPGSSFAVFTPQYDAPRIEIVSTQPGYVHRPPVHTVSQMSHYSAPQVLNPVQHHQPVNIQISHFQTHPPTHRVLAHPPPPAAVAPPSHVEVIRPTVVSAFPPFQHHHQQPQTHYIPTSAFQPLAETPVHTVNKNVVHFQHIQPTKDAQIFEVKTKVVDHGNPPPPLPVPQTPSSNNNNNNNNNVIILPQHSSRHVIGSEPKQDTGLTQVKLSDFTAAHQRLPHPEQVLKNLPPPANRPPQPVAPPRAPEPFVFLGSPPALQAPLDPRSKGVGSNESVNKYFGNAPAVSEQQSEMGKFLASIKQHHMNEVKMVKKHEEQLQTLASRVMPFFRMRPMTAVPPPRMFPF